MTPLQKTARITGLWYLALALCGVFGFLVIRPALYAPGDPAATLSHLTRQEGLAHLGVVLELGIVAFQALAAVWFYRLFRGLDSFAAGCLAAFGLVNAVILLASAGFLATALTVAGDSGLAPAGDAAATVQLLYELSSRFWAAGALFFGLWLLPMGWVAATSGRMPRPLGWVLLVGGFGYILSAFLDHGFGDAPGWVIEGLTLPASVGEFWMIGYLLVRGIRDRAAGDAD